VIHERKCVACGSREISIYPARIAPFVASRLWKSQKIPSHLVRCQQCLFTFFNPRFDESENSCLYKDYRGLDYQRERQRYEPFYTKEFNEALGNNSKEIQDRRENISALIKKHVRVADVNCVLDFGGDRGQFIPEEFSAKERFVYDISGIKPMEGITTISDYSLLQNYSFQFVMCCHVLEHISYPLDMLKQILELGDSGTVFYFEVPFESPFDNKPGSGRMSFNGLWPRFKNLAMGSANYCIVHPIWGLRGARYLFPRLWNQILNNQDFWMHEHINLFSTISFENLLRHAGFRPLEIRESNMNIGWPTAGTISCLCRKA
jgi:hypothetical protein